MKKAIKLFEEGEYAFFNGNYEEAIKCYEEGIRLFPNATAFDNLGSVFLQLGTQNKEVSYFEKAIEKYKQAIELDSNNPDTFHNLGTAFLELACVKKYDEILLKEACGNFEKVFEKLEISHKNSPYLFATWGKTLFYLARENENESLYEEACEKFEKAINIDPDNADVYFNWGLTISNLIRNKQEESLYYEAFDKYQKATELSPSAKTFHLWAILLYDLANIKQDESLFKQSFKKFEKAIELDKGNADVFFHYGIAYYNLAILQRDELLYENACKNFEQAIEINNNFVESFHYLGLSLYGLSIIKRDELLIKKSCEKFENATKLEPNNIYALKDWGNALAFLANLKNDELLFGAACKKYEEAIKINDNNANIFHDYGIAFFNFALKRDMSLFEKAREKFEKVTELEPNNANAFYHLGIVLINIANIKKNDLLFEQACAKFEKVTELEPNNAEAFYNWGNIISYLASLENNESLFKKACNLYEKTTEINQNHADAFYRCGLVYSSLADMTTDDKLLLFEKACNLYEKTTDINQDNTIAFDAWYKTLNVIANTTQNEELFEKIYEKSDYFKKLKKDIIEIIVSLKSINLKSDDTWFYKLLDKDSGNYDSKFFYDTIKNKEISDEKILQYKRIYIFSVLIISTLHVKNKNEKYFAHYLKKKYAQEMLLKNKKTKFTLNAINYSNDPTEGKILLKYLFDKNPTSENFNSDYSAFASCFTFNYDCLNQFRLYGKEEDKEATGLSLVFTDNFFNEEATMPVAQYTISTKNTNVFLGNEIKPSISYKEKNEISLDTTQIKPNINNFQEQEIQLNLKTNYEPKHALFRCIYIDPETPQIETLEVGQKEAYLFYREKYEDLYNKGIAKEEIEKYEKEIKEEVKTEIEQYKEEINDITKQVIKTMKYLKMELKDLNTEEDQKIIGQLLINLRYLTKHIAFKEEQECRMLKIRSIKDENVKVDDDFKRMYIKYLEIPNYVKEIYFGPHAKDMELFQDILIHEGLNIPCKKSKNPFK